MNATEDFVKLPPHLAAEICAQYRKSGQSGRAAELHHAYLQRNGVNLGDAEREIRKADRAYEAVEAAVAATQSARNIFKQSVSRLIGDWKTCEHCQSRIKAAAKVCRYCQRDLAQS